MNMMENIQNDLHITKLHKINSSNQLCESDIINYRFAVMCSNCYEIITTGVFNANLSASIKLNSKISKDNIDITNIFPYPIPENEVYIKCPKCNEECFGIIIDKNFDIVIPELNKLGLRTLFSCAGHPYQYTFDPYILFKNKKSLKYFNLKDPLLKYWSKEYMNHTDSDNRGCLRINHNKIKFSEVEELYIDNKYYKPKYITDLEKYIKNLKEEMNNG